MTIATVHKHGGGASMVPHTPVADVVAGTVIEVGGEVRIAHVDLPANELGNVAAPCGNVTYRVAKTAGVGEAIADGTKLYNDDAADVGTATAGALKQLGVTVGDAGDDDEFVYFRHCATP